MVVKVSKPALNLREKINELDRKPGEFGGRVYDANSSDVWNKITNLEVSPLPYWTSYYGNNTTIGQSNSSHTFLDTGNQRYYTLNNGNNGPNARFRMQGVLRGEFELGFTLGYAWGWSGALMIPRSNFNPQTNFVKDANGPHVRTFNNSSNNMSYAAYKSDYGQANFTSTTTLTGFSSGMFKVWRNAAGMMYFRPPNNTDYSLFSTSEDIFIINESQSPNFIKLEYVLCASH